MLTRRAVVWSFLIWIFNIATAPAAVRYIDNAVAVSGNGQSWAGAWKNLSDAMGLLPGDTVYISGGTTSQTYRITSAWTPAGGSNGNPIHYLVGQDAGHNGTVVIDGGGTSTYGIVPANWVTINGNVGGQRHLTVQNMNSAWVVAESKTGVTLLYMTITGDSSFNSSSYYEIGFCDLSGTWDHAISLSAPPAAIGWDVNKIHDNIFHLWQTTQANGIGADGLQWGNSLSVYNNYFQAVLTNYTGGQHQDGIQTDGRYVKVYNNIFENIGNYAVFFECFGNVSDMRVYNNVIFMSVSSLSNGAQQGIAIGRSGGASGTISFNTIVVANNTVANYGGVAVAMTPGSQSVWNNTDLFYNNAGYAVGGWNVDGNVAGSGSATNKLLNSGGSNIFVKYQAPGGSVSTYDFHLKTTDTVLKDQGVSSVSTIFNTDRDGVIRPQGPAWDIGAYEYASGGVPPPPPPPGSACDVNADGTTNIVDVQQCVNQSLGVAACTADINKDGICNVVDVQRVVNAALGGQCVSP